jgi:MFS family permease
VSTISSFGNGVIRPALTSLVTQNAARHEQGVALGVSQSLNSVALIIAPIVGGTLIGHELLTQWAWVAAAAALVGLVAARWGSSLVTQGRAETPGTTGVG